MPIVSQGRRRPQRVRVLELLHVHALERLLDGLLQRIAAGEVVLEVGRQHGDARPLLGVTALEMETGQVVLFQGKATLFATGSEVAVALEARETLQAAGVPTAVVSVPCWELFWDQPAEYRARVIGRGAS